MIPSFFIAHGVPSMVMNENKYTDLLRKISKDIAKPKAIVIFSAHYEGTKLKIGATSETYDMLYDFYGFNEELYYVQYPAHGDKTLAEKIKIMFNEHEIEAVLDKERGIDHGVWSILKIMYPDADIPIVPISINPFITPEEYYKLGQIISPLKEEDILIIGSGGIIHNLDVNDNEIYNPLKLEIEFYNWI
jgi:4,5-DOPA dioxygenase extradiol